jgi:DMSO/TMAO reductase YedYZ molybdopterin-dependent catalytic subunit
MNLDWRALCLMALVAAVVLLSACAPRMAPTTPEAVAQTPAGSGGASLPPPPTPAALVAGEATAAPSPSPPALVAEETIVPPTPTLTPPADGPADACDVLPIVVPTPAEYPGYTRLDPSTGLHVTGKMQLLDPATYRLRVTGKVERPLELTYDEIRCLPKVQASPVLECPGFFVDEATWAGAPIAEVLALAGVQDGAGSVEFIGADDYASSLSLEEALDRANFLAYEWEGQPLPRLHGFPLRLVVPGAQGNKWTKWLVEMEVH